MTAVRTPWKLALLVLAVAAVAALAGVAGAIAAERFSDVPDDHPFDEDITWLADAGISEGFPDDTFRPGAPVSRQAMAAFMRRMAGADPTVAPMVDAASLAGTDGQDLLDEVADLADRVDQLEGELAASDAEVDRLTGLLDGVERLDVDGRDTLRLSAVNLQVVNGEGETHGEPNGLGNIILGVNEERTDVATSRSGSHYLVVGDAHEYTGTGGIVAGHRNTVGNRGTSVLSGLNNVAEGLMSVVVNGTRNTASGNYATVVGGELNTADGGWSAIVTGLRNTTTADANIGSVLAGQDNEVAETGSAILGGEGETLTDSYDLYPPAP